MIEDYLTEQKDKTTKTYASVSFGSRNFAATQLNFSTFHEEFLALCFASDVFANFRWMHRSLSEFQLLIEAQHSFQSNSVYQFFWNCLIRVLSIDILVAHLPGKANSGAGFSSGMQIVLILTSQIKLTDQVHIRQIEIELEAKAPTVSVEYSRDFAIF